MHPFRLTEDYCTSKMVTQSERMVPRMTQTMWQKPWIRILTTILTVGIMIMIFAFSMENAEQSDLRSGVFSRTVISIIHPDYNRMAPEQQKTIYDSIQHLVRKSAHFTEYLLLGFMIRLCLESWFGNRMKKIFALPLIGLAAGTAYACTDEMHQLLIDGRSGQWTDVLVDGSGVLTGVLLGTLFIRRINRKVNNPDTLNGKAEV